MLQDARAAASGSTSRAGDVLRLDEALTGMVDFDFTDRSRGRMFSSWTIERADTSIRYRQLTFQAPEETLTVPISIDRMTGHSQFDRAHADTARENQPAILGLPPVRHRRPHRAVSEPRAIECGTFARNFSHISKGAGMKKSVLSAIGAVAVVMRCRACSCRSTCRHKVRHQPLTSPRSRSTP